MAKVRPMRLVLLLAGALSLPSLSWAEPFRDVVRHPPGYGPGAGGAKAFAKVSHLIYLNPCLPAGCTLRPGFDDSRTDRSSLADHQTLLTAYPWGQTHWNNMVQCVKELYA